MKKKKMRKGWTDRRTGKAVPAHPMSFPYSRNTDDYLSMGGKRDSVRDATGSLVDALENKIAEENFKKRHIEGAVRREQERKEQQLVAAQEREHTRQLQLLEFAVEVECSRVASEVEKVFGVKPRVNQVVPVPSTLQLDNKEFELQDGSTEIINNAEMDSEVFLGSGDDAVKLLVKSTHTEIINVDPEPYFDIHDPTLHGEPVQTAKTLDSQSTFKFRTIDSKGKMVPVTSAEDLLAVVKHKR